MYLLKDILKNGQNLPIEHQVNIERILLYNKTKQVKIFAAPHHLLDESEQDQLAQLLQEEFQGSQIKVVYNYSGLVLDEENITLYFAHLVQSFANGEGAIARHLFSRATYMLQGDVVTAHLLFDAQTVLENIGAKSHLETEMYSEIGKKYALEFTYGNKQPHLDTIREKEQQTDQMIAQIIEKKEQEKPPVFTPIEVKENPIDEFDVQLIRVIKGTKLPIDSDILPIAQIGPDTEKAIIRGDIVSVDSRRIKSGKTILTFIITDYTSSIKAKLFCGAKDEDSADKKEKAQARLDKLTDGLKPGVRVMMSIRAEYDSFDKEVVVTPGSICEIEKHERMDDAPEKRIELHLHTQMSAMDGLMPVKEAVALAAKWGHKAIAITDHGVVQAFPEAFSAARKTDVKVIYGVEGYLEGDMLEIVYGDTTTDIDGSFVVFDVETTGLNSQQDVLIELGAVKIENGQIVDRFSSFIQPGRTIPPKITELTGITDEMVADAPLPDAVVSSFADFVGGSVLVAHNANFDMGFLRVALENADKPCDFCYMDTLTLCRALFPHQKRHGLAAMVKLLDINLTNHHRAVDDAEATAEILKRCFDLLRGRNLGSLATLNRDLLDGNEKRAGFYHIILLAKNKQGLQNLYHIITESHMKYFYKKPIMPRHLIREYREGLIVGSACEAGELYRAILNGRRQKDIDNIASFYDYLEIQPLGNNEFLKREGRVSGDHQLETINRRIIEVGKRLQKPVVATCDVHFKDPQDEVFRRILMAGQGYSDADNQAPLYMRTTAEMLDEFSYLGEETAYQVVIKAPNAIADQIEDIMLLPDEPHPPKEEGADEQIIALARKKAMQIYGDDLPEIVRARMDRELESITKHGFSIMYLIAQRLVKKSLEDGYLVGSRGSVGSSFVAFLTDITEVNALMPHYICPGCKHSEFITDGSVGTGYDMADKTCPNCGSVCHKDGHDIPFETFLGFDGDKEPDIDLNFSGEYQANAHKYTEVLFGQGYVFRAGTIGTIAEKTAYGYVKKYLDERGLNLPSAEIDRLVRGCTGVKRTTGQHPGGIMVVPKDEDIHYYCPVQHPADAQDTDIVTTHFDYHAISGRLLKLDILGHDDPTVIRMLEDLTGVNARTIALDDAQTMAIFTGTATLDVTPDEIFSEVGSFGVPEFGTGFVRKMLIDTQPSTFSELVRISGLSHGTDVWLNNAQDLVRGKIASLKEVICTRDDIMTYLIYAGLPKKSAFQIMESVRKGKGVNNEQEDMMREYNVPAWYIDSCKKIKYMFPKAHAAAYVMMAFRIAYFKVHHPKEFYATCFSVRADEFDASLMGGTKENVLGNLQEMSKREDLTEKEKRMVTILELCNEMYARGIQFLNIDIYKSDAHRFIPMEDGILPPLSALPGLGEKAALSIAQERKNGAFFTKEDILKRTKISKTVLQMMDQHGCLEGIPDTPQVSMFG